MYIKRPLTHICCFSPNLVKKDFDNNYFVHGCCSVISGSSYEYGIIRQGITISYFTLWNTIQGHRTTLIEATKVGYTFKLLHALYKQLTSLIWVNNLSLWSVTSSNPTTKIMTCCWYLLFRMVSLMIFSSSNWIQESRKHKPFITCNNN